MVVLAGPETESLGRFAIRALAPAAAIAMSAGRLPKHSPSVDPNEDGAFMAVGPYGALACVVDGHLGFDVAARVLEVLKVEGEHLLARPIHDLQGVVHSVMMAVKAAADRALAAAPPERSSSGAAMTLALYSGGKVAVATVGDTLGLLTSPKGRTRVFARGRSFLRDLRGRVRVEVVKTPAHSRLILASDGLIDFTSQGLVSTLIASTMKHEPREAAYTLMDAALLGGAGDNVTVLCMDVDKVPAAAAETAAATFEHG